MDESEHATATGDRGRFGHRDEHATDHLDLGLRGSELRHRRIRDRDVGQLCFIVRRNEDAGKPKRGVQNAMINLYKLDRTDKKKFREDLLRISGKWSPYRTYACLHLWRWKDNQPVAAKKAAKKG